MLFLELALIRWTGESIVYLSFFANFVLLGTFLGIGVGFLAAGKESDWIRYAPATLLGLISFVLVFPVTVNRINDDVLFFGVGTSGVPPWVLLPVIFVWVAAVMAMVTQALAKAFGRFPPLEAYRLDILGSIAGISAFSVLSFLHSPPLVWGAVVVVALFLLTPPTAGSARNPILLAGIVVILGAQSFAPGESWSPYYRISTLELTNLTQVTVNGIPHQTIGSIENQLGFYQLPYRHLDDPASSDVLVIGAGNGVDVASALSHGVRSVDAIEIDPRLYELGVQLNPDRPYQDSRVNVVIDDARAYLERTEKKYDLIVFALPDSLTLVAGQSALRLESYLFTTEAITSARDHLGDDGTLVMYNFYREEWLVARLARSLVEVFETEPCIELQDDLGVNMAVLSVGGRRVTDECDVVDLATAPDPITDDYPFLYVRERSIPSLYTITIGLILILSMIAVRTAGGSLRQSRPYLDLFFMGAAFLLLETKSIVQFALLFGTTWTVNALVFAGILLSVFAAVEVARARRLPSPQLLYTALLAALAVAWLVPQRALLELGIAPRFATAVLLTFTPIFIANLIFAQRFKATSSSTIAFGTNLLGGMVGGVLEYASLVTGFRALLIVVGVLYTAAYFLGRQHFDTEPPPAEETARVLTPA